MAEYMPFMGETACYPWHLALTKQEHKHFGTLFAI